ncbi:sodium:solute symporter family protein [Glutamicibacter sp. PS]|uniref:sodium:solute symporter family protein n=1 Tax=Glutamicibacter sp. PS TaxID=3075634 RepID=UPI002846A598|nr:sodium:solute symporter family protein [Glutamicibacter sp. PS]MDR4532940.1 sodium:solute symporter family protein [Glutamicibacter sp. PS]
MQITHIFILVGYIALMIGVGLWFSRSKSVASGEDFLLAGRSLPAPVLAGTLLATFVGSGSIIGAASFIYQYGPWAGMFFFAGTFAGIIVLFFLAKRVHQLSKYTIPQLLEVRFGKPVRIIATVIILVAFIGITAYQFTGAGYIISLITPLTPVQGTIVAAVLITFLALGGGLKSVAWTDFLSIFIVAVSLIALAIYVFAVDLGGISSYVNALDPIKLTVTGGLTPLQLLGYFLPLFLLILGDQNMYQRLAAAASANTARTATIFFFIGAAIVIAPIILLASGSSVLQPGIEADMAILSLAGAEFSPLMLGGLLLTGAFALIVTTGSSYLLTCSGNIVHDLVGQIRGREVSDWQALVIGRMGVLGVALLAYVMVQFFPSVLALQIYAYTMYGVAITPALFAALFWKRATGVAVAVAMIVGGVVTITWEVQGLSEQVNAIIISLPITLVVLVVLSLLTQPRSPRVESGTHASLR